MRNMWSQNPSEALPHQDPIKKEKQNHLEDGMFPVFTSFERHHGRVPIPFSYGLSHGNVNARPTTENTQKASLLVADMFATNSQ